MTSALPTARTALAGDQSEPPEVRETHSAVVLLLGDRAYKIKKPVNLGFLDFRSEVSRRTVCRRELELNRRLAADVYLDVVSIRGSDQREYEYGVAMRRMPDRLRLSTMIRRGDNVDDHLRALARLMARFHSGARRDPQIDAEAGSVGLRRRWMDNLRETERFRAGPLSEALHDQIAQLALRYVDGRQRLLGERAEAGLYVDGHGDLIAEDIFCLPDFPRVLDCIEFDDRLRWVDVIDDVAFLAMDLEHHGRTDLATRFMEWYIEFSGCVPTSSLQHHYIAYRAFVRAKVACIRAAQGVETAATDAVGFARQTRDHLQEGEVTLLLIGGAPGTGKTTLARGIADQRGWVLLSSDEVRRQVPSLADRYTDMAKEATYRELLARAHQALIHGESVVADATWGQETMRTLAENVAVDTVSRLVAIECRAPPDVTTARAQQRLDAGSDASQADAGVARVLVSQRDPWPSATPVETETSVALSLESASAVLDAAADP